MTTDNEQNLKLCSHLKNLNLFNSNDLKLGELFIKKVTDENIKSLKEAFINQKRMIRNNSDLTFKSIIDMIPDHYKHVNNELKFICQMVDSLQELEFSSGIMGGNFAISYPIPPSTRCAIVEWLSNLLIDFYCKHSTFEISIAIFDQFLIRNGPIDQISIFKLAITATLIAFKMEEIQIPSISNMLDLVGSNVTKNEIVDFEIEVLRVLEFRTNIYPPSMFLKIFILISHVDNYKLVFEMGNLFIDIALTDVALAGYPYSFLAATVFCFSNHMINGDALDCLLWNKYYVYLTGIKWNDINVMCEHLSSILRVIYDKDSKGSENAMLKKYRKHDNISQLFISRAGNLFKTQD